MLQIRGEAVTEAVRAEVAAAFDTVPAMIAKTDTSGGQVTGVDCLAGGQFFRVLLDGAPVAWYVLRARSGRAGLDAEIAIAYGRAGVDLVEQVLPMIERQAASIGCRELRIETRRAGLMRKLDHAGYRRSSVILTKELQ
ncbi:hypothetical protein [Burkholderia stagnalis]|uniref:hypothetical protein n=1 Tax=Burkholderia stagnalis TaxID=1503054 RepID=UPI000F56C5C6|nr:hypothetical protein [Burkholderia stagnalis]RQQ65599.1 hypothetical protein DF137_22455 [Burkholderia stagnalis]RQQ78232.1 hypothetical protein DF138_21750 [Burkholderia stagnalis]RQQ87835.1 hypothetical protein DF136_21420 [Burkholderia stagnalis]